MQQTVIPLLFLENKFACKENRTWIILRNEETYLLRFIYDINADGRTIISGDANLARQLDISLQRIFGLRFDAMIFLFLHCNRIKHTDRNEDHILKDVREQALNAEERMQSDSSIASDNEHSSRRILL